MATETNDGTRVKMGSEEFYEVLTFLIHEAELLDADDLEAWGDLLADDVDYRVPVRTTRWKNDAEDQRSQLLFDDSASIKLRIRRLVGTETSWANNPPARTRRFVSNLRVSRGENGILYAKSYLLVMRNRLDSTEYDMISAQRDDTLVPVDGELRLTRRVVTVDQARLGTSYLSLFL